MFSAKNHENGECDDVLPLLQKEVAKRRLVMSGYVLRHETPADRQMRGHLETSKEQGKAG